MWLIYATLASALWGLSYTISEQVYKYASLYTTIAVNTLLISIAFFLVAYSKGILKTDLQSITSSSRTLTIFTSGIVVFALAELFIALSITHKNATLAGLIEISYPFFIALFAFLIFKESQLNTGIAIGGLCILMGVLIVYRFSA